MRGCLWDLGCAWMCRKNGIEYRSFFHFKDSKVDGHSPSKHVTFVTLVTLPMDPLCSLTALRHRDRPIGQGGWKHDMCFYMFLPYNTNAQRQVCCFAETILRYILPKKKWCNVGMLGPKTKNKIQFIRNGGMIWLTLVLEALGCCPIFEETNTSEGAVVKNLQK